MPGREGMKRLLILGGTTEARALADQARQRHGPGLDVITSLAGRTANPVGQIGQDGAVRVGGFGGVGGLADYLERQSIDVVIDATHPFAATMSDHADRACAQTRIPRLMVVRAAWKMQDGDHWIEVDDLEAAVRALAALKKDTVLRVMLTLGASAPTHFADLEGVWFLARMIEAPGAPLPLRHARVIEGRGPFTEAGERALLTRHRIDVLVSRLSGGDATYAKIIAARGLGLPVVMIKRPALAPGPHAETVADALDWLDQTLALATS